ncbi:MAG TPA: hypothetical protein VJR58_00500 [Vineibacter sp.]|nr:hypothetical protein [Vineibacter sp.]
MPESPSSGVRLRPIGGTALTVLRGSGNDPTFIAGAARWLGQPLPDSYMDSTPHGVCRLGPDEWLVIGQAPPEGLPPTTVIAVDVSSARSIIRLDGVGIADLLATGCALDFDNDALAPGRFAQTRLGPFAVLLMAPRDADGAVDILISRSYAKSLVAWLTDAGAMSAD